MLIPAGKRIFVGKKTITASSDYKTETFDYVIRSFSYKTRTCGFSLSYRKNNFSCRGEQVFYL
ncbi:hypothetical protein F3B51_14905 [Bacteroides ovatus]|uniref:Uncharacterized protein n=1 Tax=Bacteroides ovatus TaxID=28116 RepID=A0A414E9I3_BACOV|nr:hypothetical protein BSCG_03529 [Bacteroides sp. 2_2_4]KAA3975722.1 hypothetical protein F3F61_12210 [Bacteroides ovatus]KAA4563558.1 hypothetical protein F3B68_11780 [Bacteroides ovatus]KAA4565732.1 hypothetical protein F3C56_11715 [Bacteroides ovatus]KAA4570145.1 hypothetical protein F3B65_13460 [Bacteroides ovatus]